VEGLHFLITNSDDMPINQGIILEKLTPERYLCYFARTPSYSRVCELDQIEEWRLFPTEEALNEFIATLKGSEGKCQQANDQENDTSLKKEMEPEGQL